MKLKIFLLTSSLIVAFSNVFSQGCSDVGFCSLKYHAAAQLKNNLALGNTIGIGDGSTFINNTYINYTRHLSSKLIWSTKFTTNYSNGALASNFNVGDVFTNLSYKAWEKNSKSLNFLGGVKIPLTDGNDKAGGKPLPTTYQSSLGTVDLLFGGNLKVKNWEFTQAWQVPLTQNNKNTFFKEYSTSKDFPSTNNFIRKADGLIRVAYNYKKAESKFSFKPNLLAIYHIAEDTYEDILGKRQSIKGSSGLTLNANVITNYTINNKNSIELSVAAPLVVREIRPDGLTRKFTIGLEYKLSF